ncbi:F-box protein SKIP8 [Spatholobus suberectus]|nr:F-box protein SKIP8 [Spatholobus suberectus]
MKMREIERAALESGWNERAALEGALNLPTLVSYPSAPISLGYRVWYNQKRAISALYPALFVLCRLVLGKSFGSGGQLLPGQIPKLPMGRFRRSLRVESEESEGILGSENIALDEQTLEEELQAMQALWTRRDEVLVPSGSVLAGDQPEHAESGTVEVNEREEKCVVFDCSKNP